jgi:hypothetical protein
LGQSDQLNQKDQKLQNRLILKICRVYYLDFSLFFIFQQQCKFLKLNDSEVFDLFDPIDRIDPKRNNAKYFVKIIIF